MAWQIVSVLTLCNTCSTDLKNIFSELKIYFDLFFRLFRGKASILRSSKIDCFSSTQSRELIDNLTNASTKTSLKCDVASDDGSVVLLYIIALNLGDYLRRRMYVLQLYHYYLDATSPSQTILKYAAQTDYY
jgi:hypothetical protein